jgi:NDP-sugar pyrophosphorylase family protein
MTFRKLTNAEKDRLEENYCHSANWDDIWVKDGFSPDRILNTRFEGSVRLGLFTAKTEIEKSFFKPCGIYNSFLRNCEIDDDSYISDVRYLSGYSIGKNVIISNVGTLAVDEETSFGNGTEIEILNEGGGRELPIFDRLTSQIAYLTVLYRHDVDFTRKVLDLISDYCVTKRSGTGKIGDGACIRDCSTIRNVNIGSHSLIAGASLIEDATIVSSKEAPVFIGTGVTAKRVIILSGSAIDGSVLLEKCFIGQGVKAGRQFSAENSAFFANCEIFHGEACGLFAGPYSVTHHKSTLLIASLVSFFNAGSGTNQSNHMYKLGPVHQGIFERGSKTGSFSYLLLPSRIGAFSVVVGKHYTNFDTSDLPFSYITEEKGRSEITPAMNLFTVGTRRDCDKWPARDRRKGKEKYDHIHFDLFNPYTAGRIIEGINVLNELSDKCDKNQDFISYKGIAIRRLLLKTTRKYYESALSVYLGQSLVKRLKNLNPGSTPEAIRKMLESRTDEGIGNWTDICGMFAPLSKIEELIDSVKNRRINSIDGLIQNLNSIHDNFDTYSWNWCSSVIKNQTGKSPSEMEKEGLIRIISDWKLNAVKLNNMILRDAEKEFDQTSKLGYGIDGGPEVREDDFRAVRGGFDTNKFVIGLKSESGEIEDEAERITNILLILK